MARGTHIIRVKIPVPQELRESFLKEISPDASQSPPKATKTNAYTDAQVLAQINILCRTTPKEVEKNDGSKDTIEKPTLQSFVDYLAPRKGYKFLPLYFTKSNKNLPTPYEKLKEMSSGREIPRLSVTKIIPYAYCELKKMYELYRGIPVKATPLMEMGSSVHRRLEVDVHPQRFIRVKKQTGVDSDRLMKAGDDSMEIVIEVDTFSEDDIIHSKPIVNESIPNNRVDDVVSDEKVNDIEEIEVDKLVTVETEVEEVKMGNEMVTEEAVGIADDEQLEKVREEIDIKESTKLYTKPIKPQDTQTSTFINTGRNKLDQLIEYKINESIKRIIELLRHGRCREISIHGYFSLSEAKLVAPPESDSIVISGIIDDLKISSHHVDAFAQYKNDLEKLLIGAKDFDDVINSIKITASNWTDADDPMLFVLINDDKTRSSNRKPMNTVNKTNLLQVGMYRRLLGLQASDANASFQSWCANMQGRSEDVNKPLMNDIVTLCCMTNNLYFQDCLKMKNGDPLTMNNVQFQPLEETYNFVNASNDPRFDVLNGEWKYSPTLAHICARLAQVQELLKPFLHDHLQVTYVSRNGDLIATVDGKYNERYVEKQVELGMQLWLGQREPLPTNSSYLCDMCEFKESCQIPQKRMGYV